MSKRNYERSQTNCGGQSIKMASKVSSRRTDETVIGGDDPDYFANNKLKLGDKNKGRVYTSVVARRGSGDEELV